MALGSLMGLPSNIWWGSYPQVWLGYMLKKLRPMTSSGCRLLPEAQLWLSTGVSASRCPLHVTLTSFRSWQLSDEEEHSKRPDQTSLGFLWPYLKVIERYFSHFLLVKSKSLGQPRFQQRELHMGMHAKRQGPWHEGTSLVTTPQTSYLGGRIREAAFWKSKCSSCRFLKV